MLTYEKEEKVKMFEVLGGGVPSTLSIVDSWRGDSMREVTLP